MNFVIPTKRTNWKCYHNDAGHYNRMSNTFSLSLETPQLFEYIIYYHLLALYYLLYNATVNANL